MTTHDKLVTVAQWLDAEADWLDDWAGVDNVAGAIVHAREHAETLRQIANDTPIPKGEAVGAVERLFAHCDKHFPDSPLSPLVAAARAERALGEETRHFPFHICTVDSEGDVVQRVEVMLSPRGGHPPYFNGGIAGLGASHHGPEDAERMAQEALAKDPRPDPDPKPEKVGVERREVKGGRRVPRMIMYCCGSCGYGLSHPTYGCEESCPNCERELDWTEATEPMGHWDAQNQQGGTK